VRQWDKTTFRLWQTHDFEVDAVSSRIGLSLFARVPLVNVSQSNVLASDLLELGRSLRSVRPVLLIGPRHMQCQSVAQGINGEMNCCSVSSHGAVPTGMGAPFGRTRERSAIEKGRRGLWFASGWEAQQFAPVLEVTLEQARLDPGLGLVLDHVPGRQVVRQIAPRTAGFHHVPQTFKDFAQIIAALPDKRVHERQIGSYQGPLFVTDIGGIRFTNSRS
jgi:hypothetical protein